MNEKLETLWEQHKSKVNTIIGKLTMATGIPIVKEAHRDLIDFAIWFDEQMVDVRRNGK